MRCLSFWRGRELAHTGDAELLELFVFQESGFAQRIEKILLDLSHLNLAGDPHQRCAEIERGLLAVKTGQARNQLGRDQQHGVRESIRIAHQQPRMFGVGGRHEIEAQS